MSYLHDSLFRLVDTHGVLHFATADLRLGEVLCGFPPQGNRLSDEAPNIFDQGAPVRRYTSVCPQCNLRGA